MPGYFPNKYKVLGSSPSTIIKTRHSAYYTLTWRPEVMFKYREMLQGLYFRQTPNNIRSTELYTEVTLTITEGGMLKKKKEGSLAFPRPTDLNLHINNISETNPRFFVKL